MATQTRTGPACWPSKWRRGVQPTARERILEWQEQQDFSICPNPEDPDACNVYNELQFPDGVYQDIREYREEKA